MCVTDLISQQKNTLARWSLIETLDLVVVRGANMSELWNLEASSAHHKQNFVIDTHLGFVVFFCGIQI